MAPNKHKAATPTPREPAGRDKTRTSTLAGNAAKRELASSKSGTRKASPATAADTTDRSAQDASTRARNDVAARDDRAKLKSTSSSRTAAAGGPAAAVRKTVALGNASSKTAAVRTAAKTATSSARRSPSASTKMPAAKGTAAAEPSARRAAEAPASTTASARLQPAREAAPKRSNSQTSNPRTSNPKTSNPKTAPEAAAVNIERKAKMPTKKNAADTAPIEPSNAAKAGATSTTSNSATSKSGSAKSATAKSAATRHVAAAFVAARKKMSPPVKPVSAVSNDIDTSKGGVEVAQIDAKTVVDETPVAVMPEAPVAAPAPVPASVVPQRQGFGARGPSPMAIARPAKVPGAKAQSFKTGEFIVYPAHGVGEIVAVEEQEVAGYKLELFVISFIKDKMILKVPLPKAASVGMRKLADAAVMKRALDTLTGRARIKRTMWSRRAQEYEAKINSGDLVAIAEVVRDLYRSDAQPEQSYSERQLYEAALDRMARELSVVQS